MARPCESAWAWAIGAVGALAAHGLGLAALVAGPGPDTREGAAIAIPIEIAPAPPTIAASEAHAAPGLLQRAASQAPAARDLPRTIAPRSSEGELEEGRQTMSPPSDETAHPPASETTAPSGVAAQANASAAAPHLNRDYSGAATARYEDILLAHLERRKRYPRAARAHRQEGVAVITFRMDRMGRVLSAHISRGSGHALLDREAEALPTRAQPLPPPPDEVGGAVIELTVPVEFFLR